MRSQFIVIACMLLGCLVGYTGQCQSLATTKADSTARYWLDSAQYHTVRDSATYHMVATYRQGQLTDTAYVYTLTDTLFAKYVVKPDARNKPIRQGYAFYYNPVGQRYNLDYFENDTLLTDRADMSYTESDYQTTLNHLHQLKQHLCHPDLLPTCAGCADAYFMLGIIYYEMENLDKSEGYQLKALELIEKNYGQNHIDYASCLNNIATMYHDQGRYALADSLFWQSTKLIKNLYGEESADYANNLNNIGLLYFDLGLLKKARPLLEKSLALTEKLLGKDNEDYAISVINVALFYQEMGEYATAERMYAEAKNTIETTLYTESLLYATLLDNFALLYANQGLYQKAQKLYTEAQRIIKKRIGNNNISYATSLNNMAFSYTESGDYPMADSLYRESLKVAKNVVGKKHALYASSLDNLAVLQSLKGNPRQSKKLHMKAYKIRKKIFDNAHPDIAFSLENLAGSYAEEKKYKKAEKLYIHALVKWEKFFGKKHPNVAHCLNNLALINQQQNKPATALPYHIRHNQIVLYRLKNQFAHLTESEKTKFLATLTQSNSEFNSFVSQYHTQHPELKMQGLQLALALKGLLLKSTLQIEQWIKTAQDTTLLATYDHWQAQKRLLTLYNQKSEGELQQLKITIEKEEQKAEQLEKTLSMAVSAIAQQLRADTAGFEQIQARLKPGQAAIEMLRVAFSWPDTTTTDSVLYLAYIIKPRQPQPILAILPDGNKLEKQYLKAYANAIKYGMLSPTEPAYNAGVAGQLYNSFWLPLQNHLGGVQTVYLSPDGVFNQINPATLFNPEAGRFLGEQLEIMQLTNCRDLLLSPRAKARQDAFLLGNPKYFNNTKEAPAANPKRGQETLRAILFRQIGNVPQLPGTEKEVTEIAKMLDTAGYQSTVLLSQHSTEAALHAIKSPKIVHLATHGFFTDFEANQQHTTDSLSHTTRLIQNQQDPLLRSGLLLAETEPLPTQNPTNPMATDTYNDGILTAKEAMALDLHNTDLVVLSACETGLGEVKNGQGVYGLQRAFMVAGAQNLIISLWSVSDQATQLLMTEFYKQWFAGKPRRKAFYLAQQAVRQQYPSPYYWGAFVMLGE